jgi:TetR/AcrR family transcriptional repressor of nem operon
VEQTDQESTRSRLIAAGARLLWERSYSAASVDDVCRLADARKGSFYHFFASKTALALEVVAAQWGRVRAQAFEVVEQGGHRGIDRLLALCERLDDLYAPAADAGAVVLGSPLGHLGQEMAHQDEALRRAVAEAFEAQAAWLARWLDEAVELGQVPPGDNRLRAQRVLALIEGALLLAKVADDTRLVADISGAVRGVVDGSWPPPADRLPQAGAERRSAPKPDGRDPAARPSGPVGPRASGAVAGAGRVGLPEFD